MSSDAEADTTSAESSAESAADKRSLFSGLRIVSLCTLLSRVLGLIRDIGMASLFGNGPIMDAFTVAFRAPNLLRRLFGEGALTAAFLPAFVSDMEHNGRDSAWRLASSMLWLLAVSLTSLVVGVELVLWLLRRTVDLGPDGNMLAGLMAVMLPYVVLICLAALVAAILHALNHFTWPALIPVMLNVAWIAGIWLVAPFFEQPMQKVYAISCAIVVGGMLQLASPIPKLLKLGFRFDRQPKHEATNAKVKSVVRTMIPVLLGLSVTQFNSLLDSLIAWGLSAPENPTVATGFAHPIESGTASALYLGQRMYQFPLGVFGIALGTVLFPLLAKNASQGRMDLVSKNLSMGLRLVIWIGIPASVGLFLMATPLTDLLFRYNKFDANDARQTSAMIGAYGSAVWAYCALLILNRGFFAIGDQTTPMYVGFFAMLSNLLINLILIWFIGGVGLAIGTAIVCSIQAFVVVGILDKKVGGLEWSSLVSTAVKTLAATLAMGIACHLTMNWIGPDAHRATRLLGPVCAAIVIYIPASLLLGLNEWRSLLKK
ncbi:murein biosynthesis integral membrane protein MurJ [bacterium]|nr:murein biosynthesis integral membrane protein MurJ [bacterium]